MGMSLGLNRGMALNNTGGGVSDALLSFLSGTNGAAWDYADSATVFENDAGTDLAEAGDGIALVNASLVGNTTPCTWAQTSAASRPTWQSTYAQFDGTTDIMDGGANTRAIFQNAPAAFFGARFSVNSLANTQHLGGWTTTTNTFYRFGIRLGTTGTINVVYRRADADAETSRFTSAGLITTGTEYTLLAWLDYANGGAGALKVFLDGVEVMSQTVTGTGNTENVTSARARKGSTLNGLTDFSAIDYRRLIAVPRVPSIAQRAAITDWLEWI